MERLCLLHFFPEPSQCYSHLRRHWSCTAGLHRCASYGAGVVPLLRRRGGTIHPLYCLHTELCVLGLGFRGRFWQGPGVALLSCVQMM